MTDLLSEKNLLYTSTIASLAAAIGAIAAWFVTWREVRRCNKVIVKMKRLTAHWTSTGHGDAYELEVWIANTGIQMQNVSVSLDFSGPGKSGSIHVPIPLSGQNRTVGAAFLRGTTASFMLASDDGQACMFLGALRDIRDQRPVISVFNNSFLARSFPLYSRWDAVRRLWNGISFRLTFKRRVGEGYKGKGVFKTYQLPYFEIPSERLRFFVAGIRKGLPSSGGPAARDPANGAT